MKARRLIDGATFDPAQLKVMRQAFDEVWEQIKPTVPERETAIEAARIKLANAVLISASAGPVELERIKAEALSAMTTRPIELGFTGPSRFGTKQPTVG